MAVDEKVKEIVAKLEQGLKEVFESDKWLEANEDARIEAFKKIGQDKMVAELQQTLKQFGTKFDLYFSESSLYEGKTTKVDNAVEEFKKKDLLYEKDSDIYI